MRDTKPKPFVFVLMPFDESFDDIYKLGIKPACQSAGAYCERVDEQIFQESILERIYNQIAKADLIVSDMAGRNPNVFYETGYAHALGKKVVLLTQKSEDIPFDLQHYPHIVYEGKIAFLKDELERRVSWYIEQPDTSVLEPHAQLQFFINAQELSNGVQIILGEGDYDRDRLDASELVLHLNVSVHNPSNRVISASPTSFALVMPPIARAPWLRVPVRLPDGWLLTDRKRLGRMLPLDWDAFTFNVGVPRKSVSDDESMPCVLRVFSPTGTTDVPFTVAVRSIERSSPNHENHDQRLSPQTPTLRLPP